MPAAIDHSHERVLIIDSSGNFRAVIKDMLHNIGFRRISAITMSQSALETIAADSFDIILLGHNLNDKYSGMQLLEEARYRDLIKVSCSWILMSSDASQESVLHAIEVEPDEVLIKPFTMTDLRQRLDSLTRRHRSLASIEKAVENKAYNRAIKLCDQLDPGHPHFQHAQYLKGRLLIELERYEEAEAIFSHCDWRNTDWRQGFSLALSRFHQGKFVACEQQLEQLLQKHPLFIPAYDLLSRIQEAREQLDRASSTLVEAVRRSPLSLARQLELGRVASRAQQLSLAEQSYRKSITLGEKSVLDSPEPYLRLANVRRLQLEELESKAQLQDEVTSIERLLAKAERRFPQAAQLQMQSCLLRSQIYEDLGQEELAEELAGRAHELAAALPETPDIEALMKSLLTPPVPEFPEEQQSAEQDAQDPEMSAKVNRIGVRNYLSGKPGPAIRYFGSAFDYDKRNVAALLNLAQLYLEAARDVSSRRKERLTMFQRYLRLASRLPMNGDQQYKYQRMAEVDVQQLDDLPDGSLGELLY